MAVAWSEVTLEEFEAFDAAAPEGFHVELIDGTILVTPAPDGDHDENVVGIGRQIQARETSLWMYQGRGLAVPANRAGRPVSTVRSPRSGTSGVSRPGRTPQECSWSSR
ncbi:hypothetical protein [Streptomyces sp. NPDC059991]|uniref:hypothetical protein n=1 Tax=unclassified Streptomyces TaxID=2593676 RepID=UPI0036A67A6E